jgi:hypothetical protein
VRATRVSGRAALAAAALVALLGAGCAAAPQDTTTIPRDPGPAEGSGSFEDPEGTVVSPRPDGQPLTGSSTTTTRVPRSTTPRPTTPTLATQLGEDIAAAQLTVPPAPAAEGHYGFIAHGADGPVVFDACRPIHYRVRVGPGPAGGDALVTEALARISAATGLRFAFDGFTDAVPTSASFPSPNATVSLSEAFTPVVIGWAWRSETDLWASEGADTLGVGGPRTIVFENEEKLSVSGFVLLAPSDTLAAGFGPGLTVGNVLLHELGHLIGLDHVDAPGEVMQARLDRNTPDGWGPGDRRGLWELGAQRGCASDYLHLGS